MPLKSKLRHLTLASKATFTTFKVCHGSSGTNELHVSSNNGNEKTSNLQTPCDKISHMYASPNDVGLTNAFSSPMEKLDDVCCGIKILDTIVIDNNYFVDEDPNSASLSELAKQLDLQELYSYDLRNDLVEDFTIDLNDLDAASKGFHSSLNDLIYLLEVVPPRKSPSTSSDDKKFPQQNDGFTELESSIVSSLETIRKVNIVDISSLEDLVKNFFKSYMECDTLRLSKMTKESYENPLSDFEGSMEKLQATLVDVEKDLEGVTSKKKKIIMLLNKYQEKLFKGQEDVTITEDEIYTIEANHRQPNDEVETSQIRRSS
ncbi:hypothetical protein R3W88_016654 [Solanum pinnatisectum]|uniref:Uncharacterized protein n=1 Tax=Solanum pinnatisectum TaxID=50273 RepID=A0AAV9KXY8_9SOLN|nr:hypothetical protein R3W88_016654 [Solanum pinnatisectum]